MDKGYLVNALYTINFQAQKVKCLSYSVQQNVWYVKKLLIRVGRILYFMLVLSHTKAYFDKKDKSQPHQYTGAPARTSPDSHPN